MEWRDEGILLGIRRHGESAAIIDAFTLEHGRHLGLVHGGGSSKNAALLQPGAQLLLDWQARLSEHLGTFRVEPLRARAGVIIGDPVRLAALNTITTLLVALLPEREAHQKLYGACCVLLDELQDSDPRWPERYALWEVNLLAALGFGLDLKRCAATGAKRDLAYVSPKTGRAVSREAGGPWADRLLPLPLFLTGEGRATIGDVREAMRLTGHFLMQWVLPAMGVKELPAARGRLVEQLLKYEMPRPPRAEWNADEEDYIRRYSTERELGIPMSGMNGQD